MISSASTSPYSSGLVLALADLGEHLPVRLAATEPESLADVAGVRTQENVGLELESDLRRQRRHPRSPQNPCLACALLQSLVLGLDGQAELGVGHCVLVA